VTPRPVLLRALALGAGSVAVAAGLAAWLAVEAGPDAARPVAAIGGVGVVALLGTLTIGRHEPLAFALALLGAAYAVILAIDDPPLDTRSAVVGAMLLATGELAYLSLDARSAVSREAGAVAWRVASVAVIALLALGLGAAVLAVADLLRTGGIAIDVLGVAAALGAIGLLAAAARDAQR
jgi:hypothetical protein